MGFTGIHTVAQLSDFAQKWTFIPASYAMSENFNLKDNFMYLIAICTPVNHHLPSLLWWKEGTDFTDM